MKTIKFGWNNLRPGEKVCILVAVIIAVGMSYQATLNGFGVISNQAIGPLALAWLGVQMTLIVGIIRGRSLAMNTLFVQLMKEAYDAKKRLGEELDPKSVAIVEEFIGDKR